MSTEIIPLLDELKFKGMAKMYPELLIRVERESLSHQEVLRLLLSEELSYRQERSIEYQLRMAKIPWTWH